MNMLYYMVESYHIEQPGTTFEVLDTAFMDRQTL